MFRSMVMRHINGLPLTTYLLTVTSVQYTESQAGFSSSTGRIPHSKAILGMLFLSKHRISTSREHTSFLGCLSTYQRQYTGQGSWKCTIKLIYYCNAATLVHKHISITERAPEFWVVGLVNDKSACLRGYATKVSQFQLKQPQTYNSI
jgi:hypothetical protein